jgi:type III restriction enzyme
MALHPDFPQSPYETFIPGHRWFAAPKKDPDSLDIPLPELCRRYVRNFKDLSALDPATFGNKRLPLKAFTDEEAREMIFKKLLDSEIDHTIHLDSAGKADWSSVIAFFAASFTEYKS